MTTSPTDPATMPDISQLSYEQARDELVQIVQALESGQAPLAESLALWERGEALAHHCATWLSQAQERLAAAQAAAEANSATASSEPEPAV